MEKEFLMNTPNAVPPVPGSVVPAHDLNNPNIQVNTEMPVNTVLNVGPQENPVNIVDPPVSAEPVGLPDQAPIDENILVSEPSTIQASAEPEQIQEPNQTEIMHAPVANPAGEAISKTSVSSVKTVTSPEQNLQIAEKVVEAKVANLTDLSAVADMASTISIDDAK